MRRKQLFWKLVPTYLLLSLAVLLAGGGYALYSLRQFYFEITEADLLTRARLVEKRIELMASTQAASVVRQVVEDLGQASDTRITLIEASGKVLADSMEEPERMDNHGNRPEILEAYSGKVATVTRFSRTVKKNLIFLALPITKNGTVATVVRVSVPTQFIEDRLSAARMTLAAASLVVILLAGGVSWIVSRRLARPLGEMKAAADRFARGDLSGVISPPDSEELGVLSESLNQMALRIGARIHHMTTQRNQVEAVLASMVEGVVAVDNQQAVLSLNHAAAEMFRVDVPDFLDRSLQEVIRNSDLHQFVEQALASSLPQEGEIVIPGDRVRFLFAHGTLLKDSSDRQIGALIVLNDVTRLRRLENLRREFVANVSHELKTPITAIKASVETILDSNPEEIVESRRFLEIIAKQGDRLHAIIEDLLSLSRIEKEAEGGEIVLVETGLKGILQMAIQDCSEKAAEQRVEVALVCEDRLRAKVNPQLLEQAVVNLVNNAVKYGQSGQRVEVQARRENSHVVISVRDWGVGIDPVHVPRLFERFYRVDKARSRKQGGTGLGLAIVKHIAQVHRGTVSVATAPGKGSTFFIRIPSN